MNNDERIAQVLGYWFEQLDPHGMCAPKQHQLWFQSRAETDNHIKSCYAELVEAALRGELDPWGEQPEGLIALILLLDQFTRNIHRGTPLAFAGDGKALSLAKNAVALGIDRAMPTIHRVFLYIPYEHSENLDDQELGIALFDHLLASCAERVREEVAGYRKYAVAHRDVIARFGRFPHRNAILGRDSTPAERRHLKQHGGF